MRRSKHPPRGDERSAAEVPAAQGAPAHVALSFMRELGRDRGATRALLDDALLDSLADMVCGAAASLEDDGGTQSAAPRTG